MSFKDDFFEALRSVKKDFFKDYEYTEPQNPQSTIPETAAPPPTAPDLQAAAPQPVETPAAEPMSNEEIGSMIESSSAAADERPPEIHTPPFELELSDEEDDEENIPPDVDATPFRTEDDVSATGGAFPSVSEFLSSGDTYTPSGGTDFGAGGDEPPRDGRIIFDNFDSGDSLNDERTVISKNTVIRGALQTEDSIRMFGQILGDIDCKSNILVAGKVRGNTSAANAYVINAQVDGNLLCDDVINVTDDAWILGNIRAQQADIDGKVKGNIEIRHMISVGSNSSIIGNISTDELEIKRGAFVNGQVMMYSPSRDVIDRFDRFDQ